MRLSPFPIAARFILIHRANRKDYRGIVSSLSPSFTPIDGGATRQESIRLGLEEIKRSIAPNEGDWILIHDGARPFASESLFRRLFQTLAAAGAAGRERIDGVVPAIPARDALKSASDGKISRSVSRDGLFQAQTPQLFRFAPLLEAHRRARRENLRADDDSEILERAGGEALLSEGEIRNVKITFASDFDAFSAEREILSGLGVDSHRFRKEGEGDHVKLGGAAIPHDRGLAGHSDADPALHALTDAILGALAEGDIGTHFPSTDPAWKDMDSRHFLSFALEKLTARGGRLLNADITIIARSPKIAPHRESIARSLSRSLKLPIQKVSVKATTTDGMGLIGRNEGIGAQAVISVCLPKDSLAPGES